MKWQCPHSMFLPNKLHHWHANRISVQCDWDELWLLGFGYSLNVYSRVSWTKFGVPSQVLRRASPGNPFPMTAKESVLLLIPFLCITCDYPGHPFPGHSEIVPAGESGPSSIPGFLYSSKPFPPPTIFIFPILPG